MELYNGFVCHPTVCSVGSDYRIIVPTRCQMALSVLVDGEEYFNHSNGIILTSCRIQQITVPGERLNKAKQYTLRVRKVIKRLPYGSLTRRPVEITYPFRPIEKTEGLRIYQIADSHGIITEPVTAAKRFSKELDLLIFNGDIADSSENIERITTVYQIASAVTGGEIPCVISRGNHDLRGSAAEHLAEYMPGQNGRSFYSFRVGCLWGLVLDCGEDKPDDHHEYGYMVCCHAFRQEETDYIRQIIAQKQAEYEAPGVKYRLVISHVPFAWTDHPPFDIEQELFTEWCRLLKAEVKPQLMLCGHIHSQKISLVGGELDHKGQPCPVLIGSELNRRASPPYFAGMGLTLQNGCAEVVFNDKDSIKQTQTVPFPSES